MAAPVVYVDVVEPGRALITGPGFSGRVGRQGNVFYVEDTDSETLVSSAAPNYTVAARKLAAFHGLARVRVEIDFEY